MTSEFCLDSEQVADYRHQGYLFPLDCFSSDEVSGVWSELDQLKNDAKTLGLDAESPNLLRTNAQLKAPFIYSVARSAKILDRIESLLGPDLLLWSAEFFIKPAQTDKIVSWHQDLTYWGLGETDDEITAWVALSDVSPESGCMRFVPGSHKQTLLPHRDTYDSKNLLSRGQEVDVDVNENDAVDVVLKPGQMSLHHGHIFHSSGPNNSDFDRVGMVFRFLTPQVKQLVSQRDYAMVVRGIDDTNNWIHVAPPLKNFDVQCMKLLEQVEIDQAEALAQGATQTLHAGA